VRTPKFHRYVVISPTGPHSATKSRRKNAERAIELIQERLTATLIVATKNASPHKPSQCVKFRRELLGDRFLNHNLPGATRIGRMKVNSKSVASRTTFGLDPEVFGLDHL
jgi:hypothetical protein